MTVLVTGAAGFIGSHLAEHLVQTGRRVIGVDNFDPYYARELKMRNLRELTSHPLFSLVEGDIRDSDHIGRLLDDATERIDTVIHLAALAGVRQSVDHPGSYYDVNILGTGQLYESCRRRGIRKFIFVSSSSVYGANSPLPFNEDSSCDALQSPYAVTKRAGELIGFNTHHLHNCCVTNLRLFSVYGPRQRPDLAIHKFLNLIRNDRPIETYGDDTSSRDYTFVTDVVAGIDLAIAQQRESASPQCRTYNLGTGRGTNLRQLLELLGRGLGRRPSLIARSAQPGDLLHTLADTRRSERELGFRAKTHIEDGIKECLKWWHDEQARRTEPGAGDFAGG